MPQFGRALERFRSKAVAIFLVVCWPAIFALPAPIVAQSHVKFPVGVGTKTLGTGLIWLATKKGFFEESALDVQPVLLRGTPVAVQALVGESLYVAMGSADAMASAAMGG